MGLVILNILLSPMAAFFMILAWAGIFGDTIYFLVENNMIEEWIICTQIYIFGFLIYQLGKIKNDRTTT